MVAATQSDTFLLAIYLHWSWMDSRRKSFKSQIARGTDFYTWNYKYCQVRRFSRNLNWNRQCPWVSSTNFASVWHPATSQFYSFLQ